MPLSRLKEDNFLLYAMQSYDNPQCVNTEEFYQDLKKIKYIKRLFRRYLSGGELKHRLILNHIIIFYNVFQLDAATRILFFKMDDDMYPLLKTFLTYLSLMTEKVTNVNGRDLRDSDISLEYNIVKSMREL